MHTTQPAIDNYKFGRWKYVSEPLSTGGKIVFRYRCECFLIRFEILTGESGMKCRTITRSHNHDPHSRRD